MRAARTSWRLLDHLARVRREGGERSDIRDMHIKMKLLMTCLLDWSRPSAGRIHFSSLARAFRNAGHETIGLLPGHGGAEPFDRTYHFPAFTASLYGQIRLSVRHLIELTKVLRREQPDAVYFRYRACAPAVVYVVRLMSSRTHIITEFNGPPSDLLLMSGHRRIIAALALSGYMHCARRSDLIRVLTHSHRDDLAVRGIRKERIIVAGTGADLQHFHPVEQSAARVAARLSPDHRYILFVGHLSHWQGVDTLLHAAPAIRRNHPDVQFIIAGTGPQADQLKKLAKDLAMERHVLFTGEIPYEDVPNFINAATICVGPLVRERSGQMARSPMKLHEYAACGKPSITVRVKGLEDLEAINGTQLIASGSACDG